MATLLDRLNRAYYLAHDAGDFQLRDQFGEDARRLREEMESVIQLQRSDESVTDTVRRALTRINGGPAGPTATPRRQP